MQWLGKFGLLLILLIIGGLIFIKSIEYYDPHFNNGYLLDKAEIFDGIFKYGLYAHIGTVPLILLTGSAQAFFRYEFTNRRLHKTLGKIYGYLILFISAPGAFIISFYAFGGWWGKSSFLLLTTLWMWFTYCGLRNGENKDIARHKSFMIRSYVLTLSAILLRILSFIFIHVFDFYGPIAYTLAAWMSWVPPLLITEGYLKYSKNPSFLSRLT
jgi:uncharacterized membrane protein